jgi:hypothetical protein
MKVKTFFFSKSKLNQIIINKYSAQNFYNKYFISQLFFNKWKRLMQVDTYSTKVLVLSKVYKSLFLAGLLKRGFSLVSDHFIYKNSRLHGSLYSGLGLKSKAKNFATIFLKRLNFWVNKKKVFLLYKVKRGGYSGLSNGIKGFIPFEHLLFYTDPFKIHGNCIIFYDISSTDFINTNFQSIKMTWGGFHFNFNRAVRKRHRLFLGGKLKLFFFSYFSLINNWLKKFNFSSIKVNQNVFIFQLILRIFFKKLNPTMFHGVNNNIKL